MGSISAEIVRLRMAPVKAMIVFIVSCTPADEPVDESGVTHDGSADEFPSTSPARQDAPSPTPGDEWSAVSSVSTTPVRLRSVDTTTGPRTLRFEIEVPKGSSPPPTSVDLVSPAMPLHGITRFPIDPSGEGRFMTTVDVPMSGAWSLYVNLGEGSDAALFGFHVEASESGPGEPGSIRVRAGDRDP